MDSCVLRKGSEAKGERCWIRYQLMQGGTDRKVEDRKAGAVLWLFMLVLYAVLPEPLLSPAAHVMPELEVHYDS